MSSGVCLRAVDPTFPRECGNPSTYNNGGCRGPDCRAAAAKAKADARARQVSPSADQRSKTRRR